MLTSSPLRRAVTWSVLIAGVAGPLGVPTPTGWSGVSEAMAQSREKPGLAVIPLGRRDGVGALAAARIEEYLRAMIDAGGVVALIPDDVVTSGRPRKASRRAKSPAQTDAQRNLDKADEALIAGRDGLESGEDLSTAYRLLEAAIERYEKYFVELVDFTKLVDAYARAAECALKLGKKSDAKAHITKALTIQSTFVVDQQRAYKDLVELVTETRDRLDKRRNGSISVKANVEDAIVFVDGVKLGAAPAEAKDLFAGTHYIQVKRDGADPWGKAVTVSGREVKLTAKLIVEEDEGSEIALAVRFGDIKPFPDQGEYHTKLVRNYSALFARQIRAQYLLFGVLARTARSIELHLFLFDADKRKVASLRPIEFATNLGDMQMKILEAEGVVRAAIASFPEDRVVTDVPEVYARTSVATAASPAAVAPPVVPSPTRTPTPEPEPEPEPDPMDSPEPDPTQSPVVRKPVTTARTPIEPTTDPYDGLVKDDDDDSIVKKWWFWTAIGVVAAGAGVAAYLATRQAEASPNFTVDAKIAP
jgi:tetratricopeptide (TPR) repeat protein